MVFTFESLNQRISCGNIFTSIKDSPNINNIDIAHSKTYFDWQLNLVDYISIIKFFLNI